MNTPSEWADEKARDIVHRHCGSPDDLINGIAKALRAARRVPDGHVREGDVDRKVLGTLPKTADGCVVGIATIDTSKKCDCCKGDIPSGVLWHPEFLDRPAELHGDFVFVGCTDKPHGQFYSTRTAAEAAKGGG
jgi:hypothetical protein